MSLFSSAEGKKWQALLCKAGFALLVVGTLFLLVLTINQIRSGQYIGKAEDTQNTITVSSSGEAAAIPDSARFGVGVTNQAETVGDAQKQSTEEINEIISYLKDQGVADEDIKTTSYDINPQYEYMENEGIPRRPSGERQLIGYEASQRVQVTVTDISQAGDLLSGVGERGADDMSGLSFVVEDREALQQKAEVAAIENTRKKAQRLADALGVSLQRVVSYDQSGGYTPKHRQLETDDVAADDPASPDMPAGESRIQQQVEITYEIQ
ncbi:MAG: hypothetical protein BRC25_02480 [Parcubacteria group bacterium SW_6_46_9]|nr:MAG: hypothetical protein BRC25_02480 [Parcubacteria group bacterium SW_6_46_9]